MSRQQSASRSGDGDVIVVPAATRLPWRHIIHAIMLSSASHVFWIASFIAYWCTPSYGFNFILGLYFFVVFFWPGTVYVNEMGSFFVHKDTMGNHARMPLFEIFKRIAIATSFMTSVVLIASLVQGHIAMPYGDEIQSALSSITPTWISDVWCFVFTPPAAPTGAPTPSQTSDQTSTSPMGGENEAVLQISAGTLLSVLKMSLGWGFSFIAHFIGFGLIPKYLHKWWTAVKLSAFALLNEEKARAQAAAAAAAATEAAQKPVGGSGGTAARSKND